MADDYRIDPIPSTDVDWTETDSLGRQWSGQSIQEFIRDGIKIAETATAEKIAATYFDSATLTQYHFKSAEDKENWLKSGDNSLVLGRDQFNFTGTINQFQVLNRMSGTNLYFTTTAGEVTITAGFLSQSKGITDASWKEIMEDALFTVYVDKGSTGVYTPIIEEQLVLYGSDFSIDVYKYLATGSNRVRIYAKGVLSGAEGNLILSVNLTTMYLSPSNFSWNKPFLEGTVYSLGGMNIGGNLQKILKVLVKGDSYEKLYEVNLGTSTYITNAYFFSGLEFPETGSGVYNVEIWLDASGLESDHLSYNIICVSKADQSTAQLVAMNEVSDYVTNGADGIVFKYTTYNYGSTSSNPTVIIKLGEQELIHETLSGVTTGALLNYSSTIEIESEASDLNITASIQLGNTEIATIPVDNSASFPAVKGYNFYINAATRSNAQENRDSIINEVSGEVVGSSISGISYSEGMDGWTVDEGGRKCLLIPAMSSVEIEEKILSEVGTGKTIEIAFKVANAADYNENIITIAENPSDPNFSGIVVKPTNVCLHSRNLNSNDLAQSYNFKDEELVHLVITIVKNYKTNYGNLAQIYVNGVKKTSFSFSGTDSFVNNANLILGSSTADLYLYKLRVYNSGFGWQDSIQNFINCLPSASEKVAAWNKINSVLDDSYKIDYDSVSGKFNTMVIEMLDGGIIPSVIDPAGGKCNVSFDIVDSIPEEVDSDFAQLFNGDWILNQTIEGQGTTAMTYFRWNFRWKLSSDYNKRRITAKKNYASSMHSHKMGATRMFNDLHNKVCGMNEANARVAVFQYPVYGFTRTLVDGTTDQYIYTFIGLYTVGPDKGDKTTFGFDNSEFEDTLMHLEGTDHTPLSVGFDYPWSETKYSAAREAMGAITKDGDVSAAWEVGAAGGLSPDEVSDEAKVKEMLDSEFKSAYEVVYNNSTCILGISSEEFTTMNSDPIAWRKKTTESGKSYSELEFWVDGVYDLYYYNQAEGIFKTNGINLLSQLGISSDEILNLSISEKNELFQAKRREQFVNTWENYWDKDDALFHDVFCELIAATDNFKKNNYPYKFKSLADGGKWKRRQDDLDSILDINNQGFAAKTYSVLFGDKSSSGSIFRGENSIFHTLVHECFKEEKKQMAHRILNAMVDLAPSGQSKIEKLISYIKGIFWDKAQNYFTKSAYNADAEWTYEEAWPKHTEGTYKNDVNPLQQSLGSHFEAERAWIELRLVFAASYYNWGPFATDNGDDTSTGQISFRASGGKTYTITPAIDFNPTILIGQSDLATAGDRILSGNAVDVIVPDMGNNDTHVYIQGADYIEDLGDLSDLEVSVDNAVLTVGSKRLRKLKVGDELPENVTSNVSTMVIGSCPSLEEIDARNLSSLTGTVDLSRCPRLRKALFSGTSLSELNIPAGSKVNSLDLPETLTTLSLINLPNLTKESLGYGSLAALTYLRLEGNSEIDGYGLLKAVVNEDGALREIRLIGFDYDGDATDIDILGKLSNGNYFGIDETGSAITGLPVIEGTINIDGAVYQDTYEQVKENFPRITMNVTGGYYIRFADDNVLAILLNNGIGDGIGITVREAENVTSIGTWFNGNTTIESFNEFEKFTGVTALGTSTSVTTGGAFIDCTSLRRVSIPPSVTTINNGSFQGCSSLESIGDTSNITTIRNGAFRDCSSLSIIANFPKLTLLSGSPFINSGIIEFIAPLITNIEGSSVTNSAPFSNCKYLKRAIIPSIKSIGHNAFYGCSELREINLGEVEHILSQAFYNCISLSIDLSLPSLSTISSSAFCNSGITSISNLGIITELPDGNFNSDNGVFSRCLDLTSVILPDSLTSIGICSFSMDSSLSSIEFPEKLTKINSKAFHDCTNLAIELNFPNLTILGSLAFQNSGIVKITNLGKLEEISDGDSNNLNGIFTGTKLTSITLPDTLKKIGAASFAGITTLNTVELGNNLENIGTSAFQNCSELKTLNFSESIKTIGARSFRGCTSLVIENLSLPNLESLGIGAFTGVNIKKISSLGNITSLPSNFENKNTLGTKSQLTEVILPETLMSISNYLFSGASKLTSINFPSSITSIGSEAFKGCSSLSFDTLELPNITSLGADAFDGVSIRQLILPSLSELTISNTSILGGTYGKGTVLERITLSENLTSIPAYSFYNYSALININLIPENITSIGNSAFYNCTSLSFEELNLLNLTSLGQNAFYGVKIKKLVLGSDGVTLTLPTTSSPQQNYGDKNVLEEVELHGVTSIPASSFYGYGSLLSCHIPESVTSIGNQAFRGCPFENRVNIPMLTTIGTQAFVSSGITHVDSLGSITSLPGGGEVWIGGKVRAGVFGLCANLISVTLPSTLTQIGDASFHSCSSLISIDLNNSEITSIGYGAFAGTKISGDVYFPKLTAIGAVAYKNTNINRVLDLGNITSLPDSNEWGGLNSNQHLGVFAYCQYLTVVIIPESCSAWSAGVFIECSQLSSLVVKSQTPPTIEANICYKTPIASGTGSIYVPDASVEAYKTATNWSSYESSIKPISQLATDNPTLYEEVKDYL